MGNLRKWSSWKQYLQLHQKAMDAASSGDRTGAMNAIDAMGRLAASFARDLAEARDYYEHGGHYNVLSPSASVSLGHKDESEAMDDDDADVKLHADTPQ